MEKKRNHRQVAKGIHSVRRWRRTKKDWSHALGAAKKPKRLHLVSNPIDGMVYCPVTSCDHVGGYRSIRGCRKHVHKCHGWYFWFEERPDEQDVFPNASKAVPSRREAMTKARSSTRSMESFSEKCKFSVAFTRWITSEWGGSKSRSQADQIAKRVLKFLRFCYPDAERDWDIQNEAIDSVLMCPEQLTEFITAAKNDWVLGYSGLVGFVNAISDAIDFRKASGAVSVFNRDVLGIVEILLSRTRRSLAKKMRVEWHALLDVEFLNAKGCWATLDELQSVIPYHKARFDQIMKNAMNEDPDIAPYELTFATHFVITMLFLDVKASRPMTYTNLTVAMVESIEGNSGIVDQSTFKTSERYGFDSLIFEPQHLEVLRKYIKFIRPHFVGEDDKGDYLLLSRQGNKLSKLSTVLGNMVYEATAKFISPTRLRQIIETESAQKLSSEEQAIVSENQKHTSQVARVHYRKMRSREVATRAKKALARIGKVSSLKSPTTISVPPPLSVTLESNVPRSSVAEQSETVIKKERHQTVSIADTASKSTPPDHAKLPALQQEVKTEKANDGWELTGETPKVLAPVRFTAEEDICLKNGIIRFGYGRWSQILRCKDYNFHERRSTQTLHQRAQLKRMKFI